MLSDKCGKAQYYKKCAPPFGMVGHDVPVVTARAPGTRESNRLVCGMWTVNWRPQVDERRGGAHLKFLAFIPIRE